MRIRTQKRRANAPKARYYKPNLRPIYRYRLGRIMRMRARNRVGEVLGMLIDEELERTK